MKKLIGVIGGGECSPAVADLAYQTGRQIADFHLGLVCGGLGGVMEAAAKGCHEAGGLTVGLLPQADARRANPYLDIIIPTGMGLARNILVVQSAAGIIAINGRFGTLSELAFALQLGIPVVGLQTWNVSENITQALNPAQAVKLLLEKLS